MNAKPAVSLTNRRAESSEDRRNRCRAIQPEGVRRMLHGRHRCGHPVWRRGLSTATFLQKKNWRSSLSTTHGRRRATSGLRNVHTIVKCGRQTETAYRQLRQHSELYRRMPSLNSAVDADDGNLALRSRVRKALKGWEDFLAQTVQDGQSAAEINPQIDPHAVANVIISLLEGATAVARINKRSDALSDAQKHLNLCPGVSS